MGNKQTRPPPAPAPAPAPIPIQRQQRPIAPIVSRPTSIINPGATNQCMVKRVELNQLQNDISNKRSEVENCNPQQTLQRKLAEKRSEMRQFIERKRSELNVARNRLNDNIGNADRLAASATQLYKELEENEKIYAGLTGNLSELERLERRERRRFLDNDPQSGVSAIFGIRTQDDKILLSYYVLMGFTLISLCFFIFEKYGAVLGIRNLKQKIYTTAIMLAIAYGISYYVVTTVA
jgi:hypothetical protein